MTRACEIILTLNAPRREVGFKTLFVVIMQLFAACFHGVIAILIVALGDRDIWFTFCCKLLDIIHGVIFLHNIGFIRST